MLRAFYVVLLLSSCDGGRPHTRTPADGPEVCPPSPAAEALAGDANGDGAVDLADAAFLRSTIFEGGPAPRCEAAVDLVDDDLLEADDAWGILLHLFEGAFSLEDAEPGDCAGDAAPEPPGCGAPAVSLSAEDRDVTVALDPGDLAVEGWSFALTSDCDIRTVTTAGTAGADGYTDPQGQRRLGYDASFVSGTVATSAVLLGLYEGVVLDGPADVLVARLDRPATGCVTCAVALGEPAATFGEPVEALVVAEGGRYALAPTDLSVEVCAE